MIVLPRSSDAAGDGGQIGSPRVATSTVIGMVLGILCLFTIVVSYQLLSCPCRRRRLPANSRAAAFSSTNTPSKSTRSFTAFGRLYRRDRDLLRPKEASVSDEKQSTCPAEKTTGRATLKSLYLASSKPIRAAFRGTDESVAKHPADSSRVPKLRERRALRSLYLDTTPRTPTKRYPCNPSPTPTTPIRKRMGGLFHLDIGSSPESPRSPSLFSPRGSRSRRLYQELHDAPSPYDGWSNEETYKTKVPSSALISPWSPSEYEFPYPSPHSQGFMSPGVPATPPPLYPPPPAYIPETPLRSPRSAFASPSRSDLTKIQSPKVTVLPPLPISPIVSKLEKEIVGEIDTWTALSQRDWHESHADGVFVISNDSEDETWEVDSIKSDPTDESAGTWEAYEL
ncbi:hypothetical protein BV20DRAFT_1028219 [Pilatotrama ljubarskyi]|nr:hypothetical protein BV20DRAFT_1028219 [Pilatotrama ljubarskyi]